MNALLGVIIFPRACFAHPATLKDDLKTIALSGNFCRGWFAFTFGSSLRWCTCRRSPSAAAHSWPFSHALMEALYVIIWLQPALWHLPKKPKCKPPLLALLTCTDGGAVCDHIWLESALPHLPKKPECRCPLAGLSCKGRWPGPSATTKAMLLATSGWHRCAGLTCTHVVFM